MIDPVEIRPVPDTAPLCISINVATLGSLRAMSDADVDDLLDQRFADARGQFRRALARYLGAVDRSPG